MSPRLYVILQTGATTSIDQNLKRNQRIKVENEILEFHLNALIYTNAQHHICSAIKTKNFNLNIFKANNE